MTGHGASRRVRSATLPRDTCASPVRPCVPITTRSASSAFAVSQISCARLIPSVTRTSTLPGDRIGARGGRSDPGEEVHAVAPGFRPAAPDEASTMQRRGSRRPSQQFGATSGRRPAASCLGRFCPQNRRRRFHSITSGPWCPLREVRPIAGGTSQNSHRPASEKNPYRLDHSSSKSNVRALGKVHQRLWLKDVCVRCLSARHGNVIPTSRWLCPNR